MNVICTCRIFYKNNFTWPSFYKVHKRNVINRTNHCSISFKQAVKMSQVLHLKSFCTFSFGHCVVCSAIYGFRLPLWYLQTLLTTVWYFWFSVFNYIKHILSIKTTSNSNRKSYIQRQNQYPYHPYIHDRLLSWLATVTTIKNKCRGITSYMAPNIPCSWKKSLKIPKG
jgi:hypothetical protein